MKVVCKECGWKGQDYQVRYAPNPFDADESIQGCPGCDSAESMRMACDEEDCWDEVCCGIPTLVGYRHTCHKHVPKEKP